MKVTRFMKNARRVKTAWIPREAKARICGRPTGPNATEARYLREVINPSYGDGFHLISYEPEPIVLTRTTKREYTADFLVQDSGGANLSMRPTYHEVKGSYHLPTHERARLAWEIAAERNPQFDFVWAELTRRGWEIERWRNGGRVILVHDPGMAPGDWREAAPDWRRHRPRKAAKAGRRRA